MKKSIIGFTFSIISGVIYLISLFVALTLIEFGHYGTYGPTIPAAIVSGISMIFALIGLIYSIKGNEEENSLGTVAKIISVLVFLAGGATSLFFTLIVLGVIWKKNTDFFQKNWKNLLTEVKSSDIIIKLSKISVKKQSNMEDLDAWKVVCRATELIKFEKISKNYLTNIWESDIIIKLLNLIDSLALKTEKRKPEKRVDKSGRKCYNIKVAAKAATDHRREKMKKLQKRGWQMISDVI